MSTKRIQALRDLASDVERLCCAAGADRLLSELEDVVAEGERRHRAMGRRVYSARYSASVRDAVCYFVCKTVLEPLAGPGSWVVAATVRRDFLMGAACRQLITENDDSSLAELDRRWTALAFDYSADIAGNT